MYTHRWDLSTTKSRIHPGRATNASQNDYHLVNGSPCTNGVNFSGLGLPGLDKTINRTNRLSTVSWDLGAY